MLKSGNTWYDDLLIFLFFLFFLKNDNNYRKIVGTNFIRYKILYKKVIFETVLSVVVLKL